MAPESCLHGLAPVNRDVEQQGLDGYQSRTESWGRQGSNLRPAILSRTVYATPLTCTNASQ